MCVYWYTVCSFSGWAAMNTVIQTHKQTQRKGEFRDTRQHCWLADGHQRGTGGEVCASDSRLNGPWSLQRLVTTTTQSHQRSWRRFRLYRRDICRPLRRLVLLFRRFLLLLFVWFVLSGGCTVLRLAGSCWRWWQWHSCFVILLLLRCVRRGARSRLGCWERKRDTHAEL